MIVKFLEDFSTHSLIYYSQNDSIGSRNARVVVIQQVGEAFKEISHKLISSLNSSYVHRSFTEIRYQIKPASFKLIILSRVAVFNGQIVVKHNLDILGR